MENDSFRLTYATMFDPPEQLHRRFDQALARVNSELGKEYPMIIGGKDRFSEKKFTETSPANYDQVLGIFQKGDQRDALDAIESASKSFPAWRNTPWRERIGLVRKAAELINQRIFEIGAAMVLSVGKNRMESLGEVAETADLLTYACDQMENNNGFVVKMGQDPIANRQSMNVSALRPYGVWLVISPFNFPTALTGGPAGAALVAGNTVVIKPSSDSPWTVRLLAECFRDAGIPDGVFNFVTGPVDDIGDALISSTDVDGLTFTGSYDVGMKIFRERAKLDYVRPVLLEMGGKNPAIVSRNADPECASLGILRSAFGLQGQKCSACSRAFIEAPIYDDIVSRLVNLAENIIIGDPSNRNVYMGPVINRSAYAKYSAMAAELSAAGDILTGGRIIDQGEYAKGYFCSPTIASNVPLDNRLWKHEMFLPILMVHRVKDLHEATALANDTQYGLTSGFYGSDEEALEFFEKTFSGVAYANRPVGATTGAWPGFQPFGGWKGSGSSGKNAGGHYYLQLYMREQILSRFFC
jgi:1-pyrroline-5-carboxylate dehydrogenase